MIAQLIQRKEETSRIKFEARKKEGNIEEAFEIL